MAGKSDNTAMTSKDKTIRTIRVSLKGVPEPLWRRVKACAATEGITICTFIVQALTARLRQSEGEPA